MRIRHGVTLSVAVGLSVLSSYAAAVHAQEEEEEQVQALTPRVRALDALRIAVGSTLTATERNAWPSRVTAGPAVAGMYGKVPGVSALRPAPLRYALADQAMHGFAVQALIAGGQRELASRVAAMPPVRDAASATAARRQLSRLVASAGAARGVLGATVGALTATSDEQAELATARALAVVVREALAAGAPRQSVIQRAEAIVGGRLPAALRVSPPR